MNTDRTPKFIHDEEYQNLKPLEISLVDAQNVTMFMHLEGNFPHNNIVELHWHEWIEVLYVLKGKSTVYTDEKMFEVEAGQILVIGSSTPHKIVVSHGAHYTQCLHINPSVLIENQCLEPLSGNAFLIRDKQAFTIELARLVENISKRTVQSQLRFKGALLSLLALMLDSINYSEDVESKVEVHDVLDQICNHILLNYRSPLSLGKISHFFGYTPQHVAYLFKKYKNQTFNDYLNSIRIRKAMYSLEQSNQRIIDVAFECGYSSEHTFIRNFKKVTGITPLKYRLDMKEKGSL
ncbi:hypothetical protein AOC36_01405 [Erysipelothrix larvae]|uniref:HTH araC/xylS-type domain-containing protein n=1 Tax=Erysipelothrix larvae TaxID=1514105 RepID=A0A0X8GYE4_9FIRM|nr:AraC family transcriptional regulator [Erysipelothrix larvae]AMC92691.1 hypothetical protein AOC36_01405 [Erysipelothrix larvae]